MAAQPGEGYRLVPGFHLPPIAFSAEEAAQLMRGAELVRGLGTPEHEQALRSATAKLEGALPDATLAEVSRVRERAEPWPRRAPSEWLAVLLEATLADRVVRLRYHSFRGDEITERDIEPHHLSYYADDWHVRGYCRLRQNGRDFRLSRIQAVTLTEERFERRVLRAEAPNEAGEPRETAMVVRVWLSASVLPWAREEQPFGYLEEEPAEGGGVFVVESRDQRRLMPWILRWGGAARVISPPEIVIRARDEARAMARSYAAA